ncbi:probable peroxygenase 5 [Phragmites australis]|uniref:probable peroxygenase 5 n=1 Tax=Phragmites australis TaxID=29695 RepID=UPI002D78C6A6|nr:probable peroxygenase 5 [Phragmites australis]
MGTTPRRWAATAGVLPPLLLLFAVLFWSPAAAAYDDARGAGVTDLQKHAAFFDGDGDGVVSLSETYQAFRALGFGVGMSSISAAFINGALGSKTRPENATSSHLDIYIENIHKGIHGSDTGSYDAEGRFVPEKFDEIFTKNAKTVPDALTSDEIDALLLANREPGDYEGWVGATSEWKILYSLGKDKDGLLRKDVARGAYDGSLFHQLVQERASGDK